MACAAPCEFRLEATCIATTVTSSHLHFLCWRGAEPPYLLPTAETCRVSVPRVHARFTTPRQYLDKSLANQIRVVVRNGTLLDVGAGSGQYGAFFHTVAAQGLAQGDAQGDAPAPSLALAPRYTGVDGVRGVEAFTRALGPPGALVTHANICKPQLDLGVFDWVMCASCAYAPPGVTLLGDAPLSHLLATLGARPFLPAIMYICVCACVAAPAQVIGGGRAPA